MYFILEGHQFENEIQTITQVFRPNEKFLKTDKISSEGITAVSILNENKCTAVIYENGKKMSEATGEIISREQKELKRLVKLCMFDALKKIIHMKTPWGILTGVRPSKIAREILFDGTELDVRRYMSELHRVDGDKVELCIRVAKAESEILRKNDGKDFSLYIGIPFCPTKCLYCSFTSYPISKYEKSIMPYLEALKSELKLIKELTAGKRLDTLYIGGGTPTSLDPDQLKFLLEVVCGFFDLGELREFTLEAGRPDTVTREKLDTMKNFGVTRISVNPQTMADETLERIGRGHTSRQFLEAYVEAVAAGFDNINLDFILGLPGEGPGDVERTFEKIKGLKPNNITVHTLAVKRASRLKENLEEFNLARMEEIEQMLGIAGQAAEEMGLQPYYMYRQKNMLGNFENVGYCAKGYEGIYNVQIMEERQTVLAAGAGAVTKVVDLELNKIQRVFNVKNVEEYISRIDEMLERKKKFFADLV